jgi:hypothetical protein
MQSLHRSHLCIIEKVGTTLLSDRQDHMNREKGGGQMKLKRVCRQGVEKEFIDLMRMGSLGPEG